MIVVKGNLPGDINGWEQWIPCLLLAIPPVDPGNPDSGNHKIFLFKQL
jgi:hypothetical protein